MQLPDELVMFFVRADPEPDDALPIPTSERAIMVSDSH